MLQLHPGLGAGEVQNEEQEATALNVAQEGHTQAAVKVSSLDKARDVRHCGRNSNQMGRFEMREKERERGITGEKNE